jgi:hypothetical protein
VIALALFVQDVPCSGQGTLFTYQGRLSDAGSPANGTNYGMVFYLYDAVTNGNLLGNQGIVSVTVSNGIFTVPLNFGSAFGGDPRWLEIAVQKNGSGFTALAPRQPIFPTPYAIFATSASNVSGTVSGSQISGTIPFTGLPPLSNALIVTRAGGIRFTNTGSDLFLGYSNAMKMSVNTGTNGFITTFGDEWATAGYFAINTAHGGHPENPASYEAALVGSGKLALVAENGNLQIGGYNIGDMVLELYHVRGLDGRNTPTAANSVGYSSRLAFHAMINSNGNYHVPAPGIMGAGISSNGAYQLVIFDDLYDGSVLRSASSLTNSGHLMASFYTGDGLRRGANLRGGLVQEKRSGTTGASCPLDFGKSYCVDLIATANAISFYTTNRTQSGSDFERRLFLIRSGPLTPTLSWPRNWTWLTATQTSLNASSVLRLQLESVGPGESNVLAIATVGQASP